MKKLLKFLAGVAVFFVLVFLVVLYITADMVGVGDKFFDAASKGDVDGAYSQLASEFKAGTSKDELMTFLDSLQVGELESVEWGERSFSGGQGNMVGTLKLQGGGSVPLSIDMIKEDEGWKIYTIRKAVSGIQEAPQARAVPPGEEVVRLVNESTMAFAEAVVAKSMAGFHDHISVLWQGQIDVARLDEIFGAFYELESDLRVLRGFAPVFDTPPSIDHRGVLIVSGHYPTTPDQFRFEQSYVFEGVGWKLVGFSANIGQ